MRDVENEIDAKVASMGLWRWGRSAVLEALMEMYRERMDQMFVRALDAEITENQEEFRSALKQEFCVRNGAFWTLKWATRFCPESGRGRRIKLRNLKEAFAIGQVYDVLVDVLKNADRGLNALSVNRESKEVVCYEGEDLTGFDAEIVEHQQAHGPVHVHASVTADSDQLTSTWCAGDYRRIVGQLADMASNQESRLEVRQDVAATQNGGKIFIPRPTLVWLDRPTNPPDVHVFDSLTIPCKISEEFMFGARSLLETPIANCESRFCALSSDIKTTACVDDYMLRLAAREDKRQYANASGQREHRMIHACRSAFEGSNGGWVVRSRVRLTDPSQEADVVASRFSDSLVIELKSTLRPESVWEVYKRNKDILKGLRQAESLVRRGMGNRALVITDGYRGDYVCWKEARMRGVTIGTLDDLAGLARDPDLAIQAMQKKAGVPTGKHKKYRLPDREAELFGWTLRLIDAVAE